MADRRKAPSSKMTIRSHPESKWPKSVSIGNGHTYITVLLDEDGSGKITVDRGGRRTHRHDLTKEMPDPDPVVLRQKPRNARPA